MIKHFIVMSSSYTDGIRVAFDITGKDLSIKEKAEQIISLIKQKCGDDVPLSTHFLETADCSWESVERYDPFFENVKCIQSIDVFIETIKKDRTLSGLDVANYILSKVKCTHLSLEKLVYFAYADYLCDFSKRLFEDEIYAFSYGPVISGVYNIYKGSGIDPVEPQLSVLEKEVTADVKKSPARSRILFAQGGMEKLQSIDKTLQRYSKYTASALVDITHREGSPWSYVDSSKHFQLISDELIKLHHYVECV